MKDNVKCLNCNWQGNEDELISINLGNDESPDFITGCKNCKTDEFLTDI